MLDSVYWKTFFFHVLEQFFNVLDVLSYFKKNITALAGVAQWTSASLQIKGLLVCFPV